MVFKTKEKGQAVLELAIFGSIILFLFGVLLSYMQRLNDEQYLQMESFRRSLQIASLGGVDTESGGGAAAQLTVLENRRHVDLSGNYQKRSPQSISASSNVFWAVPAVGAEPNQRVYVRVNEDYSPDLANEEDGVENINTASTTVYSEELAKQESQEAITTTRTSNLKDTITTTLLDKDGNTLWAVEQGAYRDDAADGQYKYDDGAVGTESQRGRSWRTGF